ncbi:MAG: SH3 domain-containing protein [Candidatus Aminicenantia bacterium]
MKNLKRVVSLGVLSSLLIFLLPGMSNGAELKLRMTVEKANIRLKPSLDSVVIGTAPLGAILESDEQIGEWFRVNLPPDEKGFVVTGYIHSSVVEVITEKPVEEKPISPPPPPPPAPPQPPAPAYQPSPGPGIGFGVKFSGGMGYLSGGDINTYLKSQVDYWDDRTNVNVDGEFKPVHIGFDLKGEVIVNFTPQLGMGFGVGYLSASKESTVENTWGTWFPTTYEDTAKQKVSAIPITFSVYFGLPMGDMMSLTANAGIGYYLGTVNWNYNYESDDGLEKYKESWKGKSNALGLHGGLGLEFNFSPNMAFVIEGVGRYAQLKGLTGDLDWEQDFFGSHSNGTEKDVTLWSFDWRSTVTGKEYPWLGFDDDKPGGSNLSNVREAKINLSSVSVRAGIKFKF